MAKKGKKETKKKDMNEQEIVSTTTIRENKEPEQKGSKGFERLDLAPELLRALREAGYSSMFPIQEQAIPPLLERKDLIGQAHTGSGKTAAFSIPMIQSLDGDKPYIQALVLVPTRELAMQVTEEFNKLAKYSKLRAYPIYGGQSITPQIERLRKKTPQVVIATPGRLIDHIERETIDLQDINFVVLDEADRMLDMGFIDDIDYILRQIPRGNQTALFSATMPEEIKRLSQRYMDHPLEVLIDSDEISLETIEQRYVLVDDRTKFPTLVEYLRRKGISSGIIFCGMKFRAQRLAEKLQSAGFKAAPIHGDLSQNQREHAMRNFRSGYIELLVATDVAARGIDVPAVSHVINYDVPQDPLTYFHRIGRTARAGRTGEAITFVTQAEYPDFSRIAGMTEVPITKLTGFEGVAGSSSSSSSPSFAAPPHVSRFQRGGRSGGYGAGGGGRSRDYDHHRSNRGSSTGRSFGPSRKGGNRFEDKETTNRSAGDSHRRYQSRGNSGGGNFSFTESVGSSSSSGGDYRDRRPRFSHNRRH
jgi:ATP-dependent RNA helicase DeaD